MHTQVKIPLHVQYGYLEKIIFPMFTKPTSEM